MVQKQTTRREYVRGIIKHVITASCLEELSHRANVLGELHWLVPYLACYIFSPYQHFQLISTKELALTSLNKFSRNLRSENFTQGSRKFALFEALSIGGLMLCASDRN